MSDGAEKELAMKFDLIKGTLVITVGRGELFSFGTVVEDDVTGQPIDLTGKTYLGKVKTAADVEVAEVTATGDSDGNLNISAGDTDAWPLEDLKIDLLMLPNERWLIPPGSVIKMNYSATVGV